MWIMTSFGILMPALRKPGTQPAGDPRDMQIRARVAAHLDVLRQEYMPTTLGPTIRGAGTDYAYRAYCTKADWADALARMALDTDYHSFKDTTHRYPGGSALHGLYLKIWSLLFAQMTTPTDRAHYDRHWRTTTTTTVSRTTRPGETVPWGDAVHWTRRHLEQLPLDDIDDLLDEIDVDIPVTRLPSGRIDHAHCDHARTRNARRRCRNRNRAR